MKNRVLETCRLSGAIMSILVISCVNVYAQASDKRTAGGFSLQIGTGIIYGGNGVTVDYQIPLKGSFRVSPFFGIGGSLGGTDTSSAKYYWLNYSAGLGFEYGNMHRLILCPQFFGSHDVYNNPPRAPISKKTLYGPSIAVGYKGTARFGLIWQAAVGVLYNPDPFSSVMEYKFNPHFNIGLGYKF